MIKFTIPCGWTAYKTTFVEILAYGGFGVCDMCGEFHTEGGFLVPVLNHWLCQSCFDDWKSRAKYYPSDVEFESGYIKVYESRLPVTKILGVCSDV